MPNKEQKTATDLEEMIIMEFRKHPELNNILSVIVTPEIFRPGGLTWECHRVADDLPTHGIMADEIIRKLQDQFDLV